MRLLRLLIKVAFICNICFLLASFIQWLPDPPEGPIVSMIIILGYVMAIIINLLVNSWLIITFMRGKWQKGIAPGWLLSVNALFCLIQLSLIIIHTVR